MTHEVVIVGGGVSGLTLARELRRQGLSPIVLERSLGVGGRCATRRIGDHPVDHGVGFLHGRSEQFRAELESVDGATSLPDWPIVRDGDGSPCRPEAFSEHASRRAYGEGVNRFARHLAEGSDIRLGAVVSSLQADAPTTANQRGTGWLLTLGTGEQLRARAVALTMPAPSAVDLLRMAEQLPPRIADLLPLVQLVHMVPCLTVIARYPEGTAAPPWDVSLPRASSAIQTVLHDSRKRGPAAPVTLVIQARAAFSRAHILESPDAWAAALLAEAATLHGSWIAQPVIMQSHRWGKARVAPGAELAHPVAVRVDSGTLLGFAGDGFNPAGGVEGAYLSGLALAARFGEWLT